MAIVHSKSRTKPSGGLRRLHRKKKKHEIGRPFVPVIVGDEARKTIRGKGGNLKTRMLRAGVANITSGKKIVRAEIKKVVENPSNPFFVRRNIITKGAIIETDKGFARVTSRPGQDGEISAVILKDYEPAKTRGKKTKPMKKPAKK